MERLKTRFETVPIAEVRSKLGSRNAKTKKRVEKLVAKREPYAVPVKPTSQIHGNSRPE